MVGSRTWSLGSLGYAKRRGADSACGPAAQVAAGPPVTSQALGDGETIEDLVYRGLVRARLTERSVEVVQDLLGQLMHLQTALVTYREQGKPSLGQEAFREPWQEVRRYLRVTANLPIDGDRLEGALNASLCGLIAVREARRTAWRDCQHYPRCDTVGFASHRDPRIDEGPELDASNDHLWRVIALLRDWQSNPLVTAAAIPGPPNHLLPRCAQAPTVYLPHLF